MNKEILEGNWKQAKGRIRETWGKLSSDEVERINGNYDQLIGEVQEKYGYSLDEARTKVNDFLENLRKSLN